MRDEIAELIERVDIEVEKAQEAGQDLLEQEETFGTRNEWKEICRQAGEYKNLTSEEEKKLFEQYKAGDVEARNSLVNSNMRMAVSEALKMYMSLKNAGRLNYTTIYDLFQEAMMGIIEAIDKYDTGSEAKFSSYAYFYIQKNLKNEAYENNGSIIRIPASTRHRMGLVGRAEEALIQILGREPAVEEIEMQLAGILSKKRIVEILDIIHKYGSTIIPIDAPIEDDEGNGIALSDIIPDTRFKIPEDAVVSDDKNVQLRKIMSESLTAQEQRILTELFGLDNGGKTLKYTELAAKMGITKQRIEQVKKRAIKKLQASEELAKLY